MRNIAFGDVTDNPLSLEFSVLLIALHSHFMQSVLRDLQVSANSIQFPLELFSTLSRSLWLAEVICVHMQIYETYHLSIRFLRVHPVPRSDNAGRVSWLASCYIQ
jgi:hypothetical protein